MAIVFVQQNKKQKVLIIILAVSLIATGFVLWLGFSGQGKTLSAIYVEENPQVSQEEIKIDFNVLKNPLLKDLQLFSEIQPLENSSSSAGIKGRENPFLQY